MAPRWERSLAAPHLSAPLLLDAELRPHRSLSLGAFKAMLIAAIVINGVVGGAFALQGALPVAGFLGLDVLALWLAFRWNYRDARAAEYVRVARGKVHVASVSAGGAVTHWVLDPTWARVARDGRGVLIRDGAGQVRVAAFLPPEECDSFAVTLSLALHRAKSGAQSPSTSDIE